MSRSRKWGFFAVMALAPGVTVQLVAHLILKVEALWLFTVFTFVFTMAALLLASTFIGWTSQTKTKPPFTGTTPPYRRP